MRKTVLTLTAVLGSFIGFGAVQAQENAPASTFDARLSGYEYPLEVKSYDFSSQNKQLQMAYMYLPAKEGMPTVTLLHGKNFNGAYWQTTADFLSDKGYGVLIPDQIGFGKSSKPKDYQYSFADLAQNTKGLIDSLGIQSTIIVGHSMGGMLASRFSLLYPDSVSKLILLNPIGLENYLHYTQYKDVEFFYENELKQSPDKIVEYQKKNYYDGAWNDQYAELVVPLVGVLQGPDWTDVAYVNALTYDMIFTQPVIQDFPNFEVPVSLIIGTRDRTGPGRGWKRDGVEFELGRYDLIGERIKAINPDIKVIELEGLGHLPQIEDFERFTAIFEPELHQD